MDEMDAYEISEEFDDDDLDPAVAPYMKAYEEASPDYSEKILDE
jgi:hypothetical protein